MKRFSALLNMRWPLIALSLAYAWTQRFVQDDAFISFRYAQNFAEGHGLAWNIGERIEGYTNFLWTVWMAPAFLLGINVVAWSYVFSLASFAATLYASSRLAEMWWGNRAAGGLAIVLLAGNYSFLSYATGGLETQFGIAWVMLGILFLQAGRWFYAALASACAVMTRMDAVLLLVPFWCGAAWLLLNPKTFAWDRRLAGFCLAILAGAAPVVAWLLWRHHYYGAWVPNTYLIKSGGPTALRGLAYAGLFYGVSGLILAAPLVFLRRRELYRLAAFPCAVAAWVVWQLYVIKVGGDFMEFRLMTPVLPLMMIALGGLLAAPGGWGWLRMTTAVGVVAMGTGFGFLQVNCPLVNTFSRLKDEYTEWSWLAREMERFLGEQHREVKIGITCAGIIPFYTRMPALDQLGLNDRDVALTGDRVQAIRYLGNRPGHVRMARWETLLSKDVNLLLNHPWIVDKDDEALGWTADKLINAWGRFHHFDLSRSIPRASRISMEHAVPPVIAWPLDNGQFWLTVYTQPHPVVDAAIERLGARIILPAPVVETGTSL